MVQITALVLDNNVLCALPQGDAESIIYEFFGGGRRGQGFQVSSGKRLLLRAACKAAVDYQRRCMAKHGFLSLVGTAPTSLVPCTGRLDV
jgi:hypothetical protein